MSIALDERIAAAFGPDAKSAEVANLIEEAEAAAVQSESAAERARARAIDPALSAADVAEARRNMENASFGLDRMQEAVRRLGERLREVKAQEENARRQSAYDAAMAERDRLAEELAQHYPALSARLAELVARVAENDAVIERINRKQLPGGVSALAGAEAVARGLRGFVDGPADIPRITADLRLPAWRYSGSAPFMWPRSEI